jgi:hypothetical protein
VALGPPEERRRPAYILEEVDGVKVYFPRGLILQGPGMRIKLGGFWKLRWLKVDGIAMAAAACAY